ncbi:MAG: hypothetical protein KAT39_06750 [Alphaproteobacteria bacterium]|nr:hypothetical protein [Alphaproteobacteria bacterium]
MRTCFKVMATAAVFLLGSAYAANAGNYGGPGFSGTAWFSEGGAKLEQMGTIHVGDEGFLMNMESQGQKVSSLAKWDSDVIVTLIHDQKMYMEIPPEQSGWEEYESRACMGYENGEKLGLETINGRGAEKWHCTGQTMVPEGETAVDAAVWYDPELKFAIKSVEDNGNIFEIRDVQIGAQDASMFKVPPGYQKLDMNAMMQQQQ